MTDKNKTQGFSSYKKGREKHGFPSKREFGFREERFEREERKVVTSIIDLRDGDFYRGVVKIMRKSQPGPVIYSVSDGYGSADAVIKECEFETDDVVEISGPVNERAGKLQIELKRIDLAKIDFSSIIEKNSKPVERDFSIKSERLEKMKPLFYKVAQRIRKAILENQSIMIRHHADSDGINAGLAIEQSCRGFMEKIGINSEFNLYRSPSKAPFYEISDVFRDVVLTKRLIEGHGQKKPLVLVLDNGSTPEDVFGIRTLKSLGFEIIVIDHHNPVVVYEGKTLVDPYLSAHINPYIVGLDSQTCAGMLCYETARLIFEEYENPSIPAVAGISDRCRIQETEDYIIKSGKTREELESIGTAVDFIAYNLKYDAGKGLFEELYANPEFVKIIIEEVNKGIENQLQSTMPYLRTQEIEGVTFSTIDLEKYTMRFKYPTPGKVIGLLHDQVTIGKENLPIISLGVLSDMVIVRATKPILPVDKMIKTLKKELPYAHIEGGGHECAGAIKFVSAHQEAVVENIRNQVKKLDYVNSKKDDTCNI